MDHLKYAWEVVSQNLVGWIIFGLVFGVVLNLTLGFGILLLPNAIRATRKAMTTGTAPEFAELFVFDTIADDAVAVIGMLVANMAGALVCGVGQLVTAPIFIFAPHIVTEGSYDGVGSIKVALEYGKANLVAILVPLLLVSVTISIFSLVTCGIGAILATPLSLVALEHLYQQHRGQVIAAGQAAQIPTRG